MKTRFLKDSGTIGRGLLVEMSHKSLLLPIVKALRLSHPDKTRSITLSHLLCSIDICSKSTNATGTGPTALHTGNLETGQDRASVNVEYGTNDSVFFERIGFAMDIYCKRPKCCRG